MLDAYVSPDARYTARYASAWRRAAAAALDWSICYVAWLLVSIPLGAVQSFGLLLHDGGGPAALPGAGLELLAQVLTLAPVVAYFTVLLVTAQTLGMRALDIHAVVASTGRAPGPGRAFARALLATALGAAVYLEASSSISDAPIGGYSRTDEQLLAVLRVVALAVVAAKLWLVVDARRQSLQDKLFGMIVVEEIVPASPARRGPWGPLDQIDLRPRASRR